jgi:ABC-2 type transport system permease protein
MLTILRVEWMKVKNYRTFWILLAISVLSIPAFNYMLYNLMNNSFPKLKGKSVLGSPFAFPDVWQTVTWNSTLLFLIPAILIITLVTNEFTYKTHRQNVIDGWSRRQFIGVKMIEIFLLSVLSTVVVLLTAVGFGVIGNKIPAGQSIWEESRFVLFYFVQMYSYSMIAFLLAMLIKRAGLAIGAFLMYMLLENVLVGIFRNIYKITAVDYLPEEVTDRLIPQPYLKAILSQQDAAKWEHHLPVYLAVAALYIVVYCLITGRRFLKSDL